jgi:hypothetical protein
MRRRNIGKGWERWGEREEKSGRTKEEREKIMIINK